jgi:hypothetical protein
MIIQFMLVMYTNTPSCLFVCLSGLTSAGNDNTDAGYQADTHLTGCRRATIQNARTLASQLPATITNTTQGYKITQTYRNNTVSLLTKRLAGFLCAWQSVVCLDRLPHGSI